MTHLRSALTPLLDPGADNWLVALEAAGRIGVRFLIVSVLLTGCAWVSLGRGSRVMGPAATLCTIAAWFLLNGQERFRETFAVAFLGLAVLPVYVAWKRGGAAGVWLFRWVPVALIGASSLSFALVWAASLEWKVQAGLHPFLVTTAVVVAGTLAAAPAWLKAPDGRMRAATLIALIGIFGYLSAPLRSTQFRVYPSDPLLAASGADAPPDVIFILIDTLRADMLSYRSASAPQTPNIDALAAESVVFENAISPAPWTFPAMTSIMTGVGPGAEHEDGKRPVGQRYGTPAFPTLAELLTAEGYQTEGIVGNKLIYRPFTVTNGLQRLTGFAPYRPERPVSEWHYSVKLTRGITDEAIRTIRTESEGPRMLYVHYFDPHNPYEPPANFMREETGISDLDKYRAEVRFVDSQLGRFLDALKSAGSYNDALIILAADHGEEFYEHGGDGHANTLYHELLHVPFLVRLPGGKPVRTVQDYVTTRSITPTVLDLLGVPIRGPEVWAPSLTPYLQSELASPAPVPVPVISGNVRGGENRWSVVFKGGMKLIQWPDPAYDQLFDLRVDPFESNSIADSRPDDVAEGRRFIAEYFKQLRAHHADFAGTGAEGADFEDRLRSLGYIQ